MSRPNGALYCDAINSDGETIAEIANICLGCSALMVSSWRVGSLVALVDRVRRAHCSWTQLQYALLAFANSLAHA